MLCRRTPIVPHRSLAFGSEVFAAQVCRAPRAKLNANLYTHMLLRQKRATIFIRWKTTASTEEVIKAKDKKRIWHIPNTITKQPEFRIRRRESRGIYSASEKHSAELEGLVAVRKWNQALKYLHRIPLDSRATTHYALVMNALIKAGQIDELHKLLQEMKQLNTPPSSETLGYLIRSCAWDTRLAGELLELFQRDFKIKVDSVVCNALLAMFTRAQNEEELLVTLYEMQRRQFKLDLHSYSGLIRFYAQRRNYVNIARILEFYEQQMEDEKQSSTMPPKQHDSKSGIVLKPPGIFTIINSPISEHDKMPIQQGINRLLQSVAKSIAALKEPSKQYIRLIGELLIGILESFQKANDYDGAWNFYTTLKEAQIPIENARFFNMLLHTFASQDNLIRSYSILDHMRDAGFRPTSSTLTTVCQLHIRLNQGMDIDQIRQIFERHNVLLDSFAYNWILSLYLKKDDHANATATLEKMAKSGFTPDNIAYGSMVQSYARSGKEASVKRLTKKILMDRIKLDLYGYQSFISACVQVKLPHLVIELFKAASQLPLKMPGVFYTRAIDAALELGRKSVAKQIANTYYQNHRGRAHPLNDSELKQRLAAADAEDKKAPSKENEAPRHNSLTPAQHVNVSS